MVREQIYQLLLNLEEWAKQAVREATTIQPRPLQVDLWPFDLESGVRVTCDLGYLCANFSLPRPLCSRLRPDVRDRQTDVRHASSLNAPTPGAGHNKRKKYQLKCYKYNLAQTDSKNVLFEVTRRNRMRRRMTVGDQVKVGFVTFLYLVVTRRILNIIYSKCDEWRHNNNDVVLGHAELQIREYDL